MEARPLLLEATRDLPGTELHSVDIMYNIMSQLKEVGYLVYEIMPECVSAWRRYRGVRGEDVLDEIGKEIDFVVLDTTHVLPGEILDFLLALPYTAENCVFVIHDVHEEIGVNIRLCQEGLTPSHVVWCCGMLMNVVKGHKVYPKDCGHELFNDPVSNFILKDVNLKSLPNIGAFIAGSETRTPAALRDVFSCLLAVWRPQLSYPQFAKVSEFLHRHYPAELADMFNLAYNYNRILRASGFVNPPNPYTGGH